LIDKPISGVVQHHHNISGNSSDGSQSYSSIYQSPPLSRTTSPKTNRPVELENLSIAQLSSLAPVSSLTILCKPKDFHKKDRNLSTAKAFSAKITKKNFVKNFSLLLP